MKHLKIYESFTDLEVGDYVRIKRFWDEEHGFWFRTTTEDFDMNNVYVITEINEHNIQPYVVKNIENNKIAYCYYNDIKLLSEEEVQIIRYNL